MQRRGAVKQNRPALNHFFQRLPDLRRLALDDPLGAFNITGVTILNQLADDKRPEEFQGHGLGQTALPHLQIGTDDDNGTARVVHTFTQQVATEPAFLTLEHVRQRFQFAPAAATQRFAPLAVVNQAVYRFLKHTLFIADNDIWRAQFEQSLEAVIAVDHPAVEVIQVGGGETAAVQLHHRPQIRGNHRQGGQNHPLGTVTALAQRFYDLQALGSPLGPLLGAGGAYLTPQLAGKLIQVHIVQNIVESFSPHFSAEDIAKLALQIPEFRFAEEVHLGQRL